MPNFEVLDARIASALNRIIHNSHFKRRISLEEQKAQKKDRFLRGRKIAYLIYEYFRVTGANDSVENYADLFTIALRKDDIQACSSCCLTPSTSLMSWITGPRTSAEELGPWPKRTPPQLLLQLRVTVLVL